MSVEAWKAIFDWGTVVLVGLTFVFGAGALITGNILSERQEKELSQVKLQTASAQKDADDANERSKSLEHANLELRSQVATLETGAAKQQERAAEAEQELLRLQDRVKIRHLSAEQRKKMIDFLTSTEASKIPKGTIRIHRLLLDQTAQAFALEIKEAFAVAGWPSDDIGRDMIPSGDTIPVGIVVIFHSSQNIPVHAGLILHALIAADLNPTSGENPGVPDGMVEILVGIKP
jgi:hypothetical protein